MMLVTTSELGSGDLTNERVGAAHTHIDAPKTRLLSLSLLTSKSTTPRLKTSQAVVYLPVATSGAEYKYVPTSVDLLPSSHPPEPAIPSVLLLPCVARPRSPSFPTPSLTKMFDVLMSL